MSRLPWPRRKGRSGQRVAQGTSLAACALAGVLAWPALMRAGAPREPDAAQAKGVESDSAAAFFGVYHLAVKGDPVSLRIDPDRTFVWVVLGGDYFGGSRGTWRALEEGGVELLPRADEQWIRWPGPRMVGQLDSLSLTLNPTDRTIVARRGALEQVWRPGGICIENCYGLGSCDQLPCEDPPFGLVGDHDGAAWFKAEPDEYFVRVAEGFASPDRTTGIRVGYGLLEAPGAEDACLSGPLPARFEILAPDPLSMRTGALFEYRRLHVLAFDRSGRVIPHAPIFLGIEFVDPRFLALAGVEFARTREGIVPDRPGETRLRVSSGCLVLGDPSDLIVPVRVAPGP